jgi:pimeloyl-ACP methyl ester carboxylesterase
LLQVASHTDTPRRARPNQGARRAAAILLERLAPEDLDLPDGSARLRLAVAGGDEVDVLLDGDGGVIDEPGGRPDALLHADPETWAAVVRDLPAGLSAFSRGRLQIRANLHLGVNFLAATSGSDDGGRVRLEVVMYAPERFRHAVLMTPSLAWLRERPLARWLRLVRPELGLLQPAPRPVVERIVKQLVPGGNSHYAAAGIDEFLRAYTTARGRAAFYAAARNIYLERPELFWDRLRHLEPPALFVWGSRDPVMPAAFERHVRDTVPQAKHVTLNCGHIPQIERPDELHAAIREVLGI